jgi:hypothetical protein
MFKRKTMEEVKICLTEEEILNTPNNYELGEDVRKKLWEIKTTENNENTKEQQD